MFNPLCKKTLDVLKERNQWGILLDLYLLFNSEPDKSILFWTIKDMDVLKAFKQIFIVAREHLSEIMYAKYGDSFKSKVSGWKYIFDAMPPLLKLDMWGTEDDLETEGCGYPLTFESLKKSLSESS